MTNSIISFVLIVTGITLGGLGVALVQSGVLNRELRVSSIQQFETRIGAGVDEVGPAWREGSVRAGVERSGMGFVQISTIINPPTLRANWHRYHRTMLPIAVAVFLWSISVWCLISFDNASVQQAHLAKVKSESR